MQKVKLVVTAIRFFLNENAAAEADSDDEEDNVLRGVEAAKSLHKYVAPVCLLCTRGLYCSWRPTELRDRLCFELRAAVNPRCLNLSPIRHALFVFRHPPAV